MPQLDPFNLTRLIEHGTLDEIHQYVYARRLELHGGIPGAARSLDVHKNTVRRRIRRWARRAAHEARAGTSTNLHRPARSKPV